MTRRISAECSFMPEYLPHTTHHLISQAISSPDLCSKVLLNPMVRKNEQIANANLRLSDTYPGHLLDWEIMGFGEKCPDFGFCSQLCHLCDLGQVSYPV